MCMHAQEVLFSNNLKNGRKITVFITKCDEKIV